MPTSIPPSENVHHSGESSDLGFSANDMQDRLSQVGQETQESEFVQSMPDGYVRGHHKYVAVFGTVMSGLGKGIFASSLAKLLKDKGLCIAPIKMEGYLNIDAGTLNPYRHGEVYVLDDGMETDMDLGTYERMLDQDLTRDNFVTSGQLYRCVLDKERHGEYLGRDVQMIPHVTGEVKYLLRRLAMKQEADVVFVEVGGTAGDYENGFFIEALRELAYEEGEHSVCFVALTYIIEPRALGEQKSKAAQLGLRKLMEAGIHPHLVACRARNPVAESARQKIAMFANVPVNRVFSMHDRKSIYTISEAMREASLDRQVLGVLGIHDRVDQVHEDRARSEWTSFLTKLTNTRQYQVRLGITGKYTALRDAYASIEKALEHAATHLAVDLDTHWIDTTQLGADAVVSQLEDLNAVIVPGGFGVRGTEGKIACVEYCRQHKVPFLGICLGFQMAVVEFARHVCGIDGAASTEFSPQAAQAVIDILPDQKKIEGLGGNMRLGGKDVLVSPGTLAAFLFGDEGQSAKDRVGGGDNPGASFSVRRRFRHRYEVDPNFLEQLEKQGMVFSGRHPKHPIMQILELPVAQHPYFIGAQFHPELTSRPTHPAPMFMGLMAAAIRHAYPHTPVDQISTRWLTMPSPAVSV